MTSTRTLGDFRGSEWPGARQSLTPPTRWILVPLPRLPRSTPPRHVPLAGEVEPDGTGGRLEPDPNNTRQLVLGGVGSGVAEGVGVGVE